MGIRNIEQNYCMIIIIIIHDCVICRWTPLCWNWFIVDSFWSILNSFSSQVCHWASFFTLLTTDLVGSCSLCPPWVNKDFFFPSPRNGIVERAVRCLNGEVIKGHGEWNERKRNACVAAGQGERGAGGGVWEVEGGQRADRQAAWGEPGDGQQRRARGAGRGLRGGGLEILDMAKEQAGSDDTSAAQTTGLDSGHNPEISGSESWISSDVMFLDADINTHT